MIAKTINYTIIAVICVVVVWCLFNRYSRTDLHGNGITTNDIRERIDNAETAIDKAEEQRTVAEKRIDDAEATANRIETSVDESGNIIEQIEASINRSESIINDIRKTGKSQNQ